MTQVLAIDQGTTNTKAVLVGPDGTVQASGSAPVAVSHRQPGWVEQDPDQLWSSVLTAVRDCLAQAGDVGDPAGVALSTQRESVLAWHRRTGRPLGPVIGWQDVRTADWCRDHTTAADDTLVRSRTGLRIDAMFSAPKIGWLLREGEAASVAAGEVCVGTIDSWLVYRLTSGHRHVVEAGNASRTLLYDVVDLAWSPTLLALFDIPASVLPQVQPSDGDFGTVLGVPGLRDGLPVLAVLADSHAALYGQGGTTMGMTKATYGTGTSVMTPTAAFVPGFSPVPSTLAWLTDGPTYAREGNILSSGATLAWIAKLLRLTIPELLHLAGTVASAGPVTLVPAFTGLGAPHWDRAVRGAITQLHPDATPAHVARAAVDAVAHQVCDIIDIVDTDSPTPLTTLRADGGATASDLLMQTQADLLGRPVEVADLPELSALGVAALAQHRLGHTPPDREPGRIVTPALDPESRAARRDHWRQEVKWLRSRPRP